jgi:hypothetical protein
MPTATEFTALGAGNGFTSCDYVAQISNYDIFTTLSGVNNINYNSFSDSQIEEKALQSLALAMKLYWNKYKSGSMSCSFSGTDNFKTSRFHPPGGITYNYSGSISGINNGDTSEPKDRVCGNTYQEKLQGNILETNSGSQAGNLELEDNSSFIVALYNGSQFLGYSVSVLSIVSMSTNSGVRGGWNSNIITTGLKSSFNYSNTPTYKVDYEFKTINGLTLIVYKEATISNVSSPTGAGYSGIVNNPSISFTSLGIEMSYVYSYVYTAPPGFDKFENFDFSSSLNQPASIDFYTY